MGKVVLDITMSLDGLIAGPNDDVERLHEWLFTGTTRTGSDRSASVLPGRESFRTSGGSTGVLDEAFRTTGAMVMGRRFFDIGEKPWGDDPPFHVPVFVLTHRPRETLIKGETTFTFVTEGIEGAIDAAKAAAGDQNVTVGGANIAQQCLKAGLLDEMQIHIVPVLLGDGIRLFERMDTGPTELEMTRVIEAPGVTHLRFRVVK
jgi:dihydrofolate reductase